tara:strand:- start:43 stop:204 length:162 start_codon:yes stop_codon:yes gene_type:complete
MSLQSIETLARASPSRLELTPTMSSKTDPFGEGVPFGDVRARQRQTPFFNSQV